MGEDCDSVSCTQVVVEGCCHGELDQIYDVIGQLQEREGVTVDLLICCGDFQVILLFPAMTTPSSFSYFFQLIGSCNTARHHSY